MRQRAQFGSPSVQKLLGSLPVVAGFSSRLRVRDVIDGLCPVDDRSELTHGQVIEVLIANRLTSPPPLVHVPVWAGEFAVEEVFGIRPEQLNDDRVGRALDAIAPQLDQIVGSVGVTAITAFGIDVSRLHWDMTSILVHGEYEQAEPEYPAPRFGHPKDRRPDLKQVQVGIAVSADGGCAGIPSGVRRRRRGGRPGGADDEGVAATRHAAPPVDHRGLGADLVWQPGRDARQVTFVAPASKLYVGAEALTGLSLAAATRVDYVAARDAGKPADKRGSWHVIEDTMTLSGTKKNDPVLDLRRVFVHSSVRATAAGNARTLKLAKAGDDLARLGRGLGSRHYPDTAAVDARLAVIAKTRRVSAYLTAVTGTDPDTGKPTLTWSFDQTAIDAEAATDGWYALLSNLPADDATPPQSCCTTKARKPSNAATPRSKDPWPSPRSTSRTTAASPP